MDEVGADTSPTAATIVAEAQARGDTSVCVSVNKQVVGVAALSDTIRPEAPGVVAALMKQGLDVFIATGDHAKTAAVVADQLGIPAHHIMAELLPSEKYTAVSDLQQEGHVVAFVGDGINDSQALVQADLGMAVGAGAEVAIDAADVVLVRNALWDVVTALRLSRATFRRICYNFVWAMGYNVLGIPVAAGVFYPSMRIRLPPALAAMAMALSSVCVVGSSLLLNRFERVEGDDEEPWYRRSAFDPTVLFRSNNRRGGYSRVEASDTDTIELIHQ